MIDKRYLAIPQKAEESRLALNVDVTLIRKEPSDEAAGAAG